MIRVCDGRFHVKRVVGAESTLFTLIPRRAEDLLTHHKSNKGNR